MSIRDVHTGRVAAGRLVADVRRDAYRNGIDRSVLEADLEYSLTFRREQVCLTMFCRRRGDSELLENDLQRNVKTHEMADSGLTHWMRYRVEGNCVRRPSNADARSGRTFGLSRTDHQVPS